MGQYFKAVNLDKAESLEPHAMASGLKLKEFALSYRDPFMAALMNLLATDWHADRVCLIGDYAWESIGGRDRAWLDANATEDPYTACCREVSDRWHHVPDPHGFGMRYMAEEVGLGRRTSEADAKQAIESAYAEAADACRHSFTERVDRAAEKLGLTVMVNYRHVRREGAPGRYVCEARLMRKPAACDRYIVNETKGIFVDREALPIEYLSSGRPVRYDPVALLLAIGNDYSSGDYHGKAGRDLMGAWVGDAISQTATRPTDLVELVCPFTERPLYDEHAKPVVASDREVAEALARLDHSPSAASLEDLATSLADMR